MDSEQRWTTTYPLSNFIRPRCAERAKRVRGKPVLIMHIGFLASFHDIYRTQSFQQNRHVIFPALVALKLLVSLISRLVACSPRFRPDTQTDGQTDGQNDYCNPRCACAPRVNNNYMYNNWGERERAPSCGLNGRAVTIYI